MRRLSLCLLCAGCLAAAHAGLENTIYGGLAIATGEGAGGMNPGLTACVQPIGRFIEYFGVGGHADYTWLSAERPAGASRSDFGAGVHLWDISLVPKGFLPLGESANLAFEVDPGLSLALGYVRIGSYSDSDFEPNFGLTFGVSFNIYAFGFAFKFKNVFSEGGNTNWITFSVGYLYQQPSGYI